MITHDCRIAINAIVHQPGLVNLYGCTIGEYTKIAAFVEIQKNVTIGKLCKIEPFAFICEGITIGDHCFIGPHVCFTNDKYPEILSEWTLQPTIIEDNVSIGAGAVILPGLTLKRGCRIAAGAIVTKNVEQGDLVMGNPARKK